MVTAVASGWFRYPFMTPGPDTISSPTSPAGTSWSLSSTIRALKGGIGRPIDPGLVGLPKGFSTQVGEHSVSP